MKKLVSLFIVFVIALSLCLPVCAEDTSNTQAVQKYGDIGRLSKLNISEDELNDVLKEIMVNSICNRYVFYDTMTDMLMALNRGDTVVLMHKKHKDGTRRKKSGMECRGRNGEAGRIFSGFFTFPQKLV